MITGKRVRLRAIEKADMPHFTAWLNDPEVYCHTSIYLPLSQIGQEKWLDTIMSQAPEQHPLGIEVQTPQGWQLAGNTSFMHLDWHNRSAEFGIFIGPHAFWNQGYGTETTRMMLRHAFNTLNLHRVYLTVKASNPRAVHVYQKVGFVQEGVLRQAAFLEGQYVDVFLMSVLRTEWQDREE